MAQWQHTFHSLGTKATNERGLKYISLTYDGLNCGHCGRNLFKTFALSRRRWRVSPASALAPQFILTLLCRVIRATLNCPLCQTKRPPFHANCRRGDGNSFLENRCHNMTAHVSGKLLLVWETTHTQHTCGQKYMCEIVFAKLLLASVDLSVFWNSNRRRR